MSRPKNWPDTATYQRAYQAERRARLRREGLCVRCGKHKPTEGRATCDECLHERLMRTCGLMGEALA